MQSRYYTVHVCMNVHICDRSCENRLFVHQKKIIFLDSRVNADFKYFFNRVYRSEDTGVETR